MLVGGAGEQGQGHLGGGSFLSLGFGVGFTVGLEVLLEEEVCLRIKEDKTLPSSNFATKNFLK